MPDERNAIRDAIVRRVESNVAVIRQLAGGGEPVFQRMLPVGADLELKVRPARWPCYRTSSGKDRAADGSGRPRTAWSRVA